MTGARPCARLPANRETSPQGSPERIHYFKCLASFGIRGHKSRIGDMIIHGRIEHVQVACGRRDVRTALILIKRSFLLWPILSFPMFLVA